MAAEEGQAEIISLLVDAGADREARTDKDVSAWLVMGDCIVHTHTHTFHMANFKPVLNHFNTVTLTWPLVVVVNYVTLFVFVY